MLVLASGGGAIRSRPDATGVRRGSTGPDRQTPTLTFVRFGRVRLNASSDHHFHGIPRGKCT
jgi:hypothetical protein